MDREELVGIQTIWWVDYQLAVGFLTGSWKSNMDVWISNQLFGNPTACLSWPRCNGADLFSEPLISVGDDNIPQIERRHLQEHFAESGTLRSWPPWRACPTPPCCTFSY